MPHFTLISQAIFEILKRIVMMTQTLEDRAIPMYPKQKTGDTKMATVVTHSPPTSEVGSSILRPYVGKLVIAYQWLAVYSTEP